MIALQPGRRVIGVVLGAGALVVALACVWLGLAAKAFSDLFLSNGWVLLLTGIVFGGLAAAMGVLLIVRSRTDPGSVAVHHDEIRITCPGVLRAPWTIPRRDVRLVAIGVTLPSRYAANAVPVASVWPVTPNVAIVFARPLPRPKLHPAVGIHPFLDPGPAWGVREPSAVALAVTDVESLRRVFASWDVIGQLTWAELDRLPKRRPSTAMLVLAATIVVIWTGRWLWRIVG